MKLKLRFLKLMLLLFILPLQMLAAELGEAGKLLATLPEVSDVETLKSTHFPEKYVFFIKQQLDAKDASKGSFEQRVILCHRGFDRPTVLVTEGYNAKYALREGYIEELSKLFDTNIITVEYRYFDKSMPSPCKLGLSHRGELALRSAPRQPDPACDVQGQVDCHGHQQGRTDHDVLPCLLPE